MSAAVVQAAEPAKPNTPDDDAVIAVNLSRIRCAQDKYASEGGSLRSAFAKAEQQGVNLSAAKRALKIVRSGKVDEFLKETSAITRYLRIMRHGITDGQLDLDLESTLAPIEEKAALDGRDVGLDVSPDAREQNNPHDLSTVAGQAWLRGFRQGRAERELVLSMKDDVEDDISADDDED